MPGPEPGLFAELKRRNVFRVAAMYAVVGWLLLQVGEVTFEPMGLPQGSLRILIILVALGFPVALVAGWLFDWTSEGLVRTSHDPEQEVARLRSHRRIDFAIIGALVLALGMALFGPDWEPPVGEAGRSRKPPTSLVVLPFDDLSPGRDQEHFAHGMSEELINLLTRIPALEVKARTTGVVAKQMGLDIPQIGERIGVGAVIEGSVRKAGERLRVTVQLIAVEDGFHIWSESYERPVGDVFAVQDSIARAVAKALRVRLTGGRGDAPTPDLAAYELYLRGIQDTLTEQGLRSGIEFLNSALQIAPEFAPAHAQLAARYIRLCQLGFEACSDVLSRAEASASEALRLDDDLPAAHSAIAYSRRSILDWKGAEASYRAAIARDPSFALARMGLGTLLVALGRTDNGLVQAEESVRLDPLSPHISGSVGMLYHNLGRHERAIELWEPSIPSVPLPPPIWWTISLSYFELGREDEAVRALLRIDFTTGEQSRIEDALAKDGSIGVQRALLAIFSERSGNPCTHLPHMGAILFVLLGNHESALSCLEEGASRRNIFDVAISPDAVWLAQLHEEPRFQAIRASMGLPD